MAKVTVYVTDDQLERLRAARGGKGGVSKAFQAFLDSVLTGGGGAGREVQGRYDYARSLMPTFSALERHRARLARTVAAGGPPADGGPIPVALDVLLYRELLRRHPDLEAQLDRELARFGLDELVLHETEGVDLAAEPEIEAEVDEDGDDREAFAPFGIPGLGAAMDELRDALRFAHDDRRRGPRYRRGRGRTVEVRVSDTDDPREVLSAADLERFQRRHDDWLAGERLTPSQMETVRELLVARLRRDDPEAEVADDTEEGGE